MDLKKTYGFLRVDKFSSSRLKVQPRESIVERIRIKGSALGHLFLPEEPVVFHITVDAKKALPVGDERLTFSILDYLGVVQLPSSERSITKKGSKYTAEIALPTAVSGDREVLRDPC